ncbi:MAG: nuclear transport factor 2 family protein [Armatimonadetes bacterium]|nr:nuclear transport factor 2 family protein [Akkermansiaceae bacterium]
MALHCPDSLSSIAVFFSEISSPKLDVLGDVYSPSIKFRDPINEASGLSQLREVYARLLEQLQDVKIVVEDAQGDETSGFLLWRMTYTFREALHEIRGTSHLKFAADGRVSRQNDYWDASWPVYGRVPLLGWVMRKVEGLIKVKHS